MKSNIILPLVLLIFVSNQLLAQWTPVLDNVVPVDIEISPNYLMDQTVYVLDGQEKIWISETGGSVWTTVYNADDPSDPSQAVLDIVLSTNFRTDNAIVMIHKDGTMEFSPDRGQHWLQAPAPEGISGMVFSPLFGEDYTMYCITGALGPVNFYRSQNGGSSWGNPISQITIGGGFYSRLWNSLDTMAKDTFAIQYDNTSLYLSFNGGNTWGHSFGALSSVSDFVFSPRFSSDSTAFVAEVSDIYRNTHGGSELSWQKTGNFPGANGIWFAISPNFIDDQTVFAAIDQYGILRSADGGLTWAPFNEGFTSILPASIAISNALPFTLFAGSLGEGGTPGKVWRNQWYTGTGDDGQGHDYRLSGFPNPFRERTRIDFDIPSASHVRLEIYDLNGRLVSVMMDEHLSKGAHSFVLENSGGELPPGIYICRIQTNGMIQAEKLVVTR
jgi:photosystem II stability/assembly factor-like uncharacterized protein